MENAIIFAINILLFCAFFISKTAERDLKPMFVGWIISIPLHILGNTLYYNFNLNSHFLFCSVFIIGWITIFMVFRNAVKNISAVGPLALVSGTAMNAIAILVNGFKMPMHSYPMVELFGSVWKLDLRHSLITDQTHFIFICDWMYIPKMGLLIFSPGDVLIYIGLLLIGLAYLLKKFSNE